LLIGVIRTIVIYLIIVFILRLMGKTQVSQLQPFELVIILMISELATVPSEDTGIPLLAGLFPVLTLFLVGLTISQLSLKSEKIRGIICGTPTLIISKGKILENEMRKNRYNLSDLYEQLRDKNIFNIADVEAAILETSGQLSVFPKSAKRSVTPEDLKLPVQEAEPAYAIILDGVLQYRNFQNANVNEQWIKTELQKRGIPDYKQVFLASIDAQRNLFIQLKEKYLKNKVG